MPDPRVIWLRDQIIERFRTAKAVQTHSGGWQVEQADEDGYVFVVADDADGAPAAVAAADVAAHIAMNDSRTVIDTCLAELEILAEHKHRCPYAIRCRQPGVPHLRHGLPVPHRPSSLFRLPHPKGMDKLVRPGNTSAPFKQSVPGACSRTSR
jgi:hypothetical protein